MLWLDLIHGSQRELEKIRTGGLGLIHGSLLMGKMNPKALQVILGYFINCFI